MQRFSSILLASAFLLSLPPLQDPKVRVDPRPLQSKAVRLANKKTVAAMQGAWRLTDMRLVEQDAAGMSEEGFERVGFCLVSGNHLSIEFHVRVVGVGGEDKGRSFVTGLHRFEIDDEGQLETTTVLGSRMSDKGLPEFEAPGTTRHYAVELSGNSMILTRDDGHTLLFDRLIDDPSHFDFFGNPVTEKEADESEGTGDEEKEKKDDGDDEGGR
ncbi:MAG TPA: hypothetical protein VGR31_04625 [Planctomycetota bacterium]|jgi:hypothetical protein|nr:hypothetical protein [Planctomycetota bacterium]